MIRLNKPGPQPKPEKREKPKPTKLKMSSQINTFKCSTGERVTKARIDRNVRFAKEQKVREFRNDKGPGYCEDCGSNQGRIDCSHTISVKYAQETSRTELAWQVNNIKLRCADCHARLDKKTNQEREMIYANGK
jgi:Zn finger protein HypA/HybF involved in hydrogenase expression